MTQRRRGRAAAWTAALPTTGPTAFLAAGAAVLTGLLLSTPPAAAVTIENTPVEITGFLDVLFTTDDETAGAPDFRFGQVELDVAACLAPNTCACVALARDPDSEAFTLGAATVEYLIAGRGSDCRHHYEKWERSGIAVGRFDIPFGLDWRVYPSSDRRTISAPDVVAATHGGWNEIGVHGFVEAPRYTARGWLTNGLDAELGEPDDDPLTLVTESAMGARASVLPWPGLEIGASGATFTTPGDGQSMTLWGVDLAGAAGPWALTAEYIRHDLDFGPIAGGDVSNRGWYAQGVRDFTGWHLFARYDDVDNGQPGPGDLRALTGGVGVAVAAPAEVRLEYRGALDDDHADTWQAQFVGGF